MKQIIVNESIVLNRVKMEIGRETKCYNAVLLADGQKVRVTYDCLTDNLVVADWFKFDQSKLPMIMELVKACFREELEKREKRLAQKKKQRENEVAQAERELERMQEIRDLIYEEFNLELPFRFLSLVDMDVEQFEYVYRRLKEQKQNGEELTPYELFNDWVDEYKEEHGYSPY